MYLYVFYIHIRIHICLFGSCRAPTYYIPWSSKKAPCWPRPRSIKQTGYLLKRVSYGPLCKACENHSKNWNDVDWCWMTLISWTTLNDFELYWIVWTIWNCSECFGMFRNDLGWTLKPKLLNPTPRILKGTPSKNSANQLKASRQSESQGLGLKVCVGNPAVRKPNPRVFDV